MIFLEGEHHTDGWNNTTPTRHDLILHLTIHLELVGEVVLCTATDIKAEFECAGEAQGILTVTQQAETCEGIVVEVIFTQKVLGIEVDIKERDILMPEKIVNHRIGAELLQKLILALHTNTEILVVGTKAV